MKVAFVCFYEAYPPAGGAASVTYHAAKYALGRKILIQFGAACADECVSDDFVIRTLDRYSDSRLRKIAGLFCRVRGIVKVLEELAPQVVVLEGASWAVYHWLLLRRIRRRLPRCSVVYHAHNVEYVLRRERYGRMAGAVTRWAERNIVRRADLVTAVSETDRAHFEALYNVRPILLSNGVDFERFDRVTASEVRAARSRYGLGPNTALFMGGYTYPPNKQGIDFLVQAVMPQVIAKRPEAILALLGGAVPHRAPWLVAPGCIPHDELPTFVKACKVGLAPIFWGSGTRLKILEYLAGGLPVVATAKGAEGLELDGQPVAMAESAAEFADGIVEFLDHSRGLVPADSARAALRTRYGWPGIMSAFDTTLRQCIRLR